MTRRTLAALRNEVTNLHLDLASLAPAIGNQVDGLLAAGPVPDRIVLSGSGDSLFAAEAASYSFVPGAPAGCLVRSTHLLRDYGVPASPPGSSGSLVVGISASGTNVSLAEGLLRARAEGHRTLAVVGCADSAVGRGADAVLRAVLPDRPPAPGVRSYQANLLCLLLLARGITFGGTSAARGGAQEAAALAEVIAETVRRQADPCRQLADLLRGTPIVQVLGSGASFGTARYVAAKLIEGAGVSALGQDLEEWWHVERFATDRDTPLVVLAPPGPSHERAVRLCAQARERGHHVTVLARPGDTAARENAHLLLPLPDAYPASWSALVEPLFAAPVAAELAQLLGRHPFHRR